MTWTGEEIVRSEQKNLLKPKHCLKLKPKHCLKVKPKHCLKLKPKHCLKFENSEIFTDNYGSLKYNDSPALLRAWTVQ